MLQSNKKKKKKEEKICDRKPFHRSKHLSRVLFFFHETFRYLPWRNWRRRSEDTSILWIRARGVFYVTLQLWMKPQTDDLECHYVKMFVFIGMKDKHFLTPLPPPPPPPPPPFPVVWQATRRWQLWWLWSLTRVEFNEHYEITLQSEKEVAFLNVPIIHSHRSKLLYVNQQGHREEGRVVNDDLLLSVWDKWLSSWDGPRWSEGDSRTKWLFSVAAQIEIKISRSFFFCCCYRVFLGFFFRWSLVSFSVLSISHTLHQGRIFCNKGNVANLELQSCWNGR